MLNVKLPLVLLVAVALAACGDNDDDPAPPRFSAAVIFGDAYSDVGTYAVGAIASQGGGKFTINGNNTSIDPALTGKNWTEVLAAQLGVAVPCAAQTGLSGNPALGFSVPVQNHAGCFGYAQGGARVSNPVGVFNAATGSPLGGLTVPVSQQIANHLAAAGGAFKGDEVVFVGAGGADLRMQLNALKAQGTTSGLTQQASDGMKALAGEFSELIVTQLLAKGARYVVVNNAPDPTATPGGQAEAEPFRALSGTMAAVFNDELKSRLGGQDKVLIVDLAALIRDEVANPAAYGLSNVNTPACGQNALGGVSLLCNAGNTLAGVNVSHYMFADGIHPTPYQYSLIARNVTDKMKARGWLQ
jgi:outer membrane lipase/esterase